MLNTTAPRLLARIYGGLKVASDCYTRSVLLSLSAQSHRDTVSARQSITGRYSGFVGSRVSFQSGWKSWRVMGSEFIWVSLILIPVE